MGIVLCIHIYAINANEIIKNISVKLGVGGMTKILYHFKDITKF